MKTRCLAMAETYAAHVQRWSDGTATTIPSSYAAEARDMISRIKQHLTREYTEALLILSDVGRIRQITDRNLSRSSQGSPQS